MNELTAIPRDFGATEVRTCIWSGNAIFSPVGWVDARKTNIPTHAASLLGFVPQPNLRIRGNRRLSRWTAPR